MNAQNCQTNASLEVKKGESAWEEATILFDQQKYDGAVSRAYYAAFHYGSALLLTKGLESRSHRGMQRLFHLHFVQSQLLSQRAGVILSHAQKAREEADYYPEVSFPKEIAEERLNEVKQFLAECREYLQKNRPPL